MQKKQNGRSMIEMLGVLAIIGVLSIGGLLGYRRAVNNHQANTILDDANRLAFVIMENDRAYEADDFMEEELIDSVPHTGTYNLDAFMADAGQFGIVVTNVPRGVCESLVPKAAVEYKVRVMPGSEEKYLVPQMANIGTIYDSFHKDICTNDTNDVVLYFNDTSPYCNKPDEGEDYTKCLSNADCCGRYFCWFPNDSERYESGLGRCEELTDTNYPAITTTMSDGRTWTRSENKMNWWSAQNWCWALGKSPANRASVGCGDIASGSYCTESSILDSMKDEWRGSRYWLEDYKNGLAYMLNLRDYYITDPYRYYQDRYHALCQ